MLAHQPDLVILDEPISGLDPLVQKKLFAELLKVKNRGAAVFLSSHVLGEVETVWDIIIMIKNGKIISQNKTQELLKNTFKIVSLPATFKPQIHNLKKTSTGFEITLNDDQIIIKTLDILPFLELAHKHQIQDLTIKKPSLEELFLEKY